MEFNIIDRQGKNINLTSKWNKIDGVKIKKKSFFFIEITVTAKTKLEALKKLSLGDRIYFKGINPYLPQIGNYELIAFKKEVEKKPNK